MTGFLRKCDAAAPGRQLPGGKGQLPGEEGQLALLGLAREAGHAHDVAPLGLVVNVLECGQLQLGVPAGACVVEGMCSITLGAGRREGAGCWGVRRGAAG